jgi:signal transduction histidine kinase
VLSPVSVVTASNEVGEIKLVFDNAVANRHLVMNLLSNLLFIVGLSGVLFLLLKRGILRVEQEVDFLSRIKSKHNYLIEEFGLLAKTIQDSHRAEKEKIFADAARQFAHDVRSPIAALKVLAESEFQNSSAESRELFNQSIKRVQNIAKDILNSSPHARQELQGELNSVNILEFMHTVVDLKKSEYLHKKNQLKIECFNFTNFQTASIPLEQGRLERILSNIINNSIEAVGAGSVAVRLEAQVQNQKLVLLVIDNGPGIPSHLLPRLGRESITTKSTSSGNGLGLLNAVRDLESRGCSLQIYSKNGQGTTIEIHMPI